jgi:redox-sensing transcriptional repressor
VVILDERKKISIAVIRRLPRYYRYLSDLADNDITKISSKELAKKMGMTASQIRQDLNCFGGFGQQGYGYNVMSLFSEIGRILGTEHNFKMVIIGAGRLGRALAHYPNFIKRGYEIVGIFDVSQGIIGSIINGVEVMHLDYLKTFTKINKVDIAVLTVPSDSVRNVAVKACDAGIKGIWNFSPRELNLPEDIVVENVHLSDSLMVLGYSLTQRKTER